MTEYFHRLSWRHKLIATVACFSMVGAVGCSTSSGTDMAPEEPTEQPEVDDHDHEHDHAHERDHDHSDEAGHHDHRFDDPEKYAERWNDPARAQWQQPELIIEAMGIEEGMTVADIGAGTGYFIPFLSEAVGEEGTVIAVDIEESMLAFIEEMADEKGLNNVETLLPDDGESGLDEASVDRILIVNTWHHIRDRENYSAHLSQRLADGGSVWNVDFHEDSPTGPPADHRLDSRVVVDEMEAGGFRAKVHEVRLERQYIVVGTVE